MQTQFQVGKTLRQERSPCRGGPGALTFAAALEGGGSEAREPTSLSPCHGHFSPALSDGHTPRRLGCWEPTSSPHAGSHGRLLLSAPVSGTIRGAGAPGRLGVSCSAGLSVVRFVPRDSSCHLFGFYFTNHFKRFFFI